MASPGEPAPGEPRGGRAAAPASGRRTRRGALALAAAIFGVATIVAGGRVLAGVGSAREAAGRYLLPVVAFNFAAGFAYVAAAAGLALAWRGTARLSAAIAGATLVVLAAFGVHAAAGGAYEARTAVALVVRSAFWIAFAVVAPRLLPPVPTRRG